MRALFLLLLLSSCASLSTQDLAGACLGGAVGGAADGVAYAGTAAALGRASSTPDAGATP